MTRNTARAIVGRLEVSVGISGYPRRLVDAIETELVSHFGLLAIRAAERAEAVAASVARLIADRAARADDSGTISTLVLVGATQDIVAGSSYVFPSDDPKVVTAKAARSGANSLLSAIQGLSFKDFERFGARILAEIGAATTEITPQSGDEGIDFYGQFSVGQFTGLPPPFTKLAHDVVVALAGQAKHYPNRSLGPDTVRELVGAVTLARTSTFSGDRVDVFAGMNLKPHSPLVTLLFTTGRISRGAAKLARTAGIIARSGEQLAAFLADKGVGMRGDGAEARFDNAAFREWLET